MTRYALVSFNSGELTPQIDARSDVDKYRSGCRILENFIPRIYGTAERRPGTKYIDTCNGVACVLPFIYSNEIAYILLLENLRMWFYYDGGRVLDTWGRRLGIDTPYLSTDIFEIQHKQSNDVMYLVHQSYAQRTLTRTSANSFSLDALVFTKGPFKKRNDVANADGITLTPSVTTGNGTLTASGDVFAAGHVGALFAITQPRVLTEVEIDQLNIHQFGADPSTGITSALPVEGSFSFSTNGTWNGTVTVERSVDGSTWETFFTGKSRADRNYVETWEEVEDGIYYRIKVTELNGNPFAVADAGIASIITATLTVNSSVQKGICRVTGYTSATNVSMTVLKTFASTDADVRWAEGCWSDYRGYPGSVTFHQERCVYAGTPHQPQTLWFSTVDDWQNFDECSKDDSAFSLTLASDTRNAIQWISSLGALIVGTTGGEWVVRAGTLDETLTPTNYHIEQHTSHGSKAIQALPVNDVILYVDSVGRKVREFTWSSGKEKFTSPDLTALAEHATKSGISCIAYQKNPDPLLWAFRADGTLISMTYEREQNVVAWARHPMIVEGQSTATPAVYMYPTLQELTASEIPTKPDEPTMTVATTAVTNATELQAMNGSNKYYLANDINLTGVTWTPITGFSGVLDGRGYTISNLTIDAAASNNQGFFSTIAAGCEIYDIIFENCTVSGKGGVGIVVGYHSSATFTFKNVRCINCTLTAASSSAGILFGDGNQIKGGTIYGCTAENCTLTGLDYIGGLLGYMDPASTATQDFNVVDCHVTGGTMTLGDGAGDAGGFLGYIMPANPPTTNVMFHSCTSSMTISAVVTSSTCQGIGGFVGYSSASPVGLGGTQMVSCCATGNVTIVEDDGAWISGVGGFVGFHANTSYTNCYATGNLTVDTSGEGPLAGGGAWLIGGFSGKHDYDYPEKLLRCYSTGSITCTFKTDTIWYGIGGFIGGYLGIAGTYEGGTIERCFSWGDISLTYDADPSSDNNGGLGGFIGYLSTIGAGTPAKTNTILNCYCWGSITIDTEDGPGATDASIGGFIGAEAATNKVIPTTITNAYCAQTDSATGSGYTEQLPNRTLTGGFMGLATATPTVTLGYHDKETSGYYVDDIGVAKATRWLQTKSNFQDAGWDFTSIWYIPDPAAAQTDPAQNSVAVIPGTGEDEVWLTVSRYINGTYVRFLEQMQPRFVDDQEDKWFVDAGLGYDSTAISSFSGLTHLEGETVAILGDGAVFSRRAVSSGAITLDESASRVIAGLPFRYKLKPMRFDLAQGLTTTKGSLKRIAELVISFWESLNVEYGVDTTALFNIDWRTEETHGSPPALYTGDKVVTHEGGFDPEDSIILTGDDPLPCVVRAMIPRLELTGR